MRNEFQAMLAVVFIAAIWGLTYIVGEVSKSLIAENEELNKESD